MDNFGLVGSNIGHSISPLIHQTIFRLLNINANYQIYDINREDGGSLEKLINEVRVGKIKGLNVTTPFKVEIIKYLDELTNVSLKTNSVNTIYLKNNKLIGDNTDYKGLEYLIKSSKENIMNKNVYILGSGGASITSYHLVKKMLANPIIVSRNNKEILIKDIDSKNNYYVNTISYDDVESGSGVIINATPVGNINNLDQTLLKDQQVENKIVFDLNYKPSLTKIMQQGKRSYNGTLMLIAQAVYANLIWHKLDLNIIDETNLINEVMEVIENE